MDDADTSWPFERSTGSSRMTVLDWLLDSDPAIRWQVLRDLVHAPAEVVAAERARVATEGWGARLLALQGEDGQWAGGALLPGAEPRTVRDENQGQPWTATLPTLAAAARLRGRPRRRPGAPGGGAGQRPLPLGARRPAVLRAARSSRASTAGPSRWASTSARMSTASSPACSVSSSRTAGGTARRRTARFARRSPPRSTSWKDCWRTSAPPVARRNRSRPDAGVRSTSSNESCSGARAPARSSNPAWLQFSFPTRWHYDVLRALEYFRSAGDAPDPRMDEAIDLLRSKQQPDGTWLLENTHPGKVHFALEDGDGRPSRWNTLRALRVLRWYEQAAT